MMTLFCTISKSKVERLNGRGAGTVAQATGMFAFERTSSCAAPAVRASRNGTIRSSARSAELVETRLALRLNQTNPLQKIAPTQFQTNSMVLRPRMDLASLAKLSWGVLWELMAVTPPSARAPLRARARGRRSSVSGHWRSVAQPG